MEDWRLACRCLQKSRVEASLFLSLFVRLPQCYWSRQRLQPAGSGQGMPPNLSTRRGGEPEVDQVIVLPHTEVGVIWR